MKIGICCDEPGHIPLVPAVGGDFAELHFGNTARQSEEDYARVGEALAKTGLQAEAMNCFIPGDFKLCTLESYGPLELFIRQGMARARALGTQIVVFGSSGARRLPEGWTKAEGWQKIAPFARLAGEIAAEYGVTIAIEPLKYGECTTVNTLREGLEFLQLAGHPNFRLLADAYHMAENGEDFADILAAGESLRHCHIAKPGDRGFPRPDDGFDYSPFFAALRRIGYQGRLSIEADDPIDLDRIRASVAYIKKLTA